MRPPTTTKHIFSFEPGDPSFRIPDVRNSDQPMTDISYYGNTQKCRCDAVIKTQNGWYFSLNLTETVILDKDMLHARFNPTFSI